MAISFVSAASAASDSISLPTHQAGDLIVVFAYNAGAASTAPTVPSGWNTRISVNQAGGRSTAMGSVVATSSAMTSGTWNDATHLACAVYRSTTGMYLILGDANSTSGSASATISYILVNRLIGGYSGESWVLSAVGTTTDTSAETPPSGMVNRTFTTSSGEVSLHDTNSVVTNWATATVAASSATFRNISAEIFETDIAIPSGGSGGVPLIGAGGLVY